MPTTGTGSRARRVYYDTDSLRTLPDVRLSSSFEGTEPRGLPHGVSRESSDEGPTLVDWALPVVGLLVGGYFVTRWWMNRKSGETFVGDGDGELELLGAVS